MKSSAPKVSGLTTVEVDSNVNFSCESEINKVKSQVKSQLNDLQQKIKTLQNQPVSDNSNKYLNFLLNDLLEKNILDNSDVDNINAKLDTNTLTIDDVISNLERLKSTAKPKPNKTRVNTIENDDSKYNELPDDFYKPLGSKEISLWDNQFSILNTDKWKVPMPRPPVCVNTSPCRVCPNDEPMSSYPALLRDWETSRKVTNIQINKDWANAQMDSKDDNLLLDSKLDYKKQVRIE